MLGGSYFLWYFGIDNELSMPDNAIIIYIALTSNESIIFSETHAFLLA